MLLVLSALNHLKPCERAIYFEQYFLNVVLVIRSFSQHELY